MRWLDELWRDIQKWWDKLWKKKPNKPRKVDNVQTEIDMAKNVTVTWDLPTERTGGASLPLSEIDRTEVELSADGGVSFISLATVDPTDAQQAFVPDMEVGDWHFRITVFDLLGQNSAGHTEIVTVIDDSPPNPVSNVQVTQT